MSVREITQETDPEAHKRLAPLFARSKEILNRWRDEASLRRGIHTYEFDRPFPAVDAALWEFLIVHKAAPKWTIKRSVLTTGSVKYTFQYSKFGKRSVFELRARMMHANSTLLHAEFTQAPEPSDLLINIGQQINSAGEPDLTNPSVELIGFIKHLTELFRTWLAEEEEHRQIMREMVDIMGGVDEEAPVVSLKIEVSESLDAALRADTQPGSGVHTSWPEDIWAWEQVNIHHQPRVVIYADWRNRLSPDRQTLRNPEDSFRKVVNPKWKGKRNAER